MAETLDQIVVNGTEYDVGGGGSSVMDDDSSADLNIGDEAGNVLAQFKDGHIKTKNFDSSNVATESYPVMYAHFSLDDIDTCISNLA